MRGIFLLILFVFSAYSVSAQWQNTVKAILLEHTVELVPKIENEATNSYNVSVLLDGKLLKQFAAGFVGGPNIVATYNSLDGDYLVYRTNTGTGICVAGSIYVLKFYTYDERDQDIKVLVSPDLSGCLGENPTVSFTYDSKLNIIVSVNDSKIRGDSLSRWITALRKTKSKRHRTK